MLWATKRVGRDEAASIEHLFRDAAFDPHAEMLLIGVDEDDRMVSLWVAAPDYDLLAPYYGFTPCMRANLPSAPILIAGKSERFGSIFHGR